MKTHKQFLLAALLFSLSVYSSAQIRFQKTFGGSNDDQGYSVQQTTDGGYIIAGTTNSFGPGNYSFYLIKTNANGDTLWTKTIGGSNADDAYSVQQTTDGGYIVAGETKSIGAGDYDVYLIKTNQNGVTQWTKTFGGTNTDWASSVQQTNDNGYVIVGTTYSFGPGDNNVYLIKTNANGDTLWTKTIGRSYPAASWGNSVQQTNDGGYVIAGLTRAGAGGINKVYLIKTTSSGDTLWTKTFGWGEGIGHSVRQTSDGGYIIGADLDNFDGQSYNVYLIKTNANGDELWTKTYGGNDYDNGGSAQQTTDGGYVIVGNTRSFGTGLFDIYLIKTNTNGDTLWTKTFGGTDQEYGSEVQQTTDGGYVIAGQTRSSFENANGGSSDVYLIKTDANGVVSVNPEESIQLNFSLEQNYPNPFNPTTTIRYSIPVRSFIKLKVFNLLGQQIATLVEKEQSVGTYTIQWEASDFPSGVYLYSLQSNDFVETKKLILLK
jgi:hypothetical protein